MQRGLKVDTTTQCRSLKLHKRVTVAMPDILDIPPSGSVDRVPKVAFRIWRTQRGGSEAAVRRIECDRDWPAAARDNSSGVEIDSSSQEWQGACGGAFIRQAGYGDGRIACRWVGQGQATLSTTTWSRDGGCRENVHECFRQLAAPAKEENKSAFAGNWDVVEVCSH